MKAVVVHQYGGSEVLKFEQYPGLVPGPGEVLVRVTGTSVNPVDYKRRAGSMKNFYPIQFPGLIGVDLAGTVVKIGPGVEGFSVGDQVFAMAADTYAELCVVDAAILAKIPNGLDLIQVAALRLVTATGNQLISATGIKAGQTVLVVGAAGNCPAFRCVHCVPVFAKPDAKTLQFMAQAVRDGKLVIPISRKLPLSQAAEAQAVAEKGGLGKVLLVA